ncbi:MAG TPA: GAF domain-containing sensor histidine kinase [Methylomirabilota bacterium]|nr:GAF domain-containing sensor histidine kinase [Methylomirabilota bacterium]
MIWLQLLLLAVITVGMAADWSASPSALRHLLLLPTLWAALSSGAMRGALIGLVAGLLQAPLALPAVERGGLTAPTLDGLISVVTPVAFGWLVGRLMDESRGHATRLRAVLQIQRCLNAEGPLVERLAAAAEGVRAALGAQRVGLLIAGDDGQPAVASPPGSDFPLRSAAGWALQSGRAVWIGDLGGNPRVAHEMGPSATPLRGLVLPLDCGRGPVGALAVERVGDLDPAARVAAEEMAMHLALGVDNARLSLRQRRFNEELEQKVTAATARLRELDEAKSEFLSIVSHELRTPITALQGFSELLLSRPVPPEQARRFLGHLHAEAQRLGRMVAELLDLARIQAGRPLEMRRDRIDLAELMERNAELFSAEHPDHRFLWASALPGLVVEADRDAVDRMVKNLLSNAVKYSPQGGRVAMAAGPAPDRPGMIELAVEDDGIGIPAEHLPRIFDRYVRIPHPETAAVRGLGLGLGLVKALAEAHGGTVEVESLPGKGSRFRILLPA